MPSAFIPVRRCLAASALGLATVLVPPAAAAKNVAVGASAAAAPGHHDRRLRAEQLGRLLHYRMDVDITDIAARDVLPFLAKRLDVPITIHWDRGERRPGIDPDSPITIRLKDATGLEILEAVLARCDSIDGDEITWQFRHEGVEVGTKTWLSRPSARVRRFIPIGDLAMQVPDWRAPDFEWMLVGGATFDDDGSPIGRERGPSDPEGRRGTPRFPDVGDRFTLEEMAPILIEDLQAVIEPELWAERRATMAHRDGVLIVLAPDFVHRQIAGYPFPAIRPTSVRAPEGDRR